MLSRILLIVATCAGLMLAQPNELNLRQDPPAAIQSNQVNAVYTGTAGGTTYYYWVVTRYPIGYAVPVSPVVVARAASSLGGGNSVALTWSAMAGASSYDVLRTSTPAAPSSCTCAVTLATTSTTLTDSGGGLSAWPPNGLHAAGSAQMVLQINNRDGGAPYIEMAVQNAQRVLNYQLGLLKNGPAPSYVPSGFIQPYANQYGRLACVDSSGADCMGSVIDVRDYGAVGDGVADDSAAWQTAISAASGGGIVTGAAKTYKLSSVVTIAVSAVTITDASFVVPRPTEDTVNRQNNYAFYINGAVSQERIAFGNLNFTGSGYWGGILSNTLYRVEGWGGGGYPNVNALNHTTTRKNFRIEGCTFDGTYFEAIFLTNVQANVDNVRVLNCDNTRNVGCIFVRNTNQISLTRISMDAPKDKAIGTDYSASVSMSDITVTNGTYNTTIEDSLGLYVGHFSEDVTITNCSVNSPTGGLLKASYYAQRVMIENCTFKGAGYVMLQGVVGGSISGSYIESSEERALRTYYSSAYTPDMDTQKVIISGTTIVSTEDGSDAPLVVDLSNATDSSLTGCTIRGNIYARPGRNVSIRENDIYFSTPYSATYAVFIRDFNGVKITGNRIITAEAESTIYLHGNSAEAGAEITGNIVNQMAGFAIVVKYATAGVFIYRDNVIYDGNFGTDLYYNYTDASKVQVFRPSNLLSGSTTWDPPPMAGDGDSVTTTLTVTGIAADGAWTCFGSQSSIGANNVIVSAFPESADTARISLLNKTGGALDVGSGTARIYCQSAKF